MSKQKLEINWIPAAGSALGAVTSAVVLSTLGVGGTLIGAALGSLTITVGGSIYAQSMQRTKTHVGERFGTARKAGAPNQTPKEPVPSEANPVGRVNASRVGTLLVDPVEPPKTDQRPILRGLPWKRIIGVTAALFAVVMALILMFELTTGRAVSSFTGGTSGTGGTSIPGVSLSPSDTEDSVIDDSDTIDPKQDDPKQDMAPEQKQPSKQEPMPQQS
ncbi:MAG: hypothetical protein Q4P23_14355, partial [Micrococcaceae bacterium]|nr:hypothetical protein [Micrococcaceae bacterium]